MVKPEGRIIWMEDSSQMIYQNRDLSEWKNWLKYNSLTNYRSPRVVVDLINALALTEEEIISASPFDGETTLLKVFDESDPEDIFRKTEIAIRSLLLEGFKAESIAVISFSGAKKSYLLNSNRTANCWKRN
jgi:hypothetical protein